MSSKIPVHLICGPLGIGKTTAIISYLKRQAGRQFVAVLVNDFGPVGLDAAIMEGDLASHAKENTAIKMLPGGCVCCTSAAGLVGALEQVTAMGKVDRVIIEPSGLAMVGDMVDVVADIAGKFGLELRPVITLVEPRLLDRPGFLKAPYYVRMVEAADILVANRCDLATTEQRTRFMQWADGLWPQKLRVLETVNGDLPDELFQLNSASWQITRPTGNRDGHSEQAFTGGCRFPATQVFDVDRVEQAIQQLAMRGIDDHAILRLKAILHTNEGWKLYEIAGGQQFCRPTDYRHENLLDWIAAGDIPQQAVEDMIAGCGLRN